MMLIGSFAGAVGSYFTGSALAGTVISVVLGAVMGWIYGLFCLKWKAQQSVVGVGVNLFASGITAVMLKAIWNTEGMSGSVPSISNITVPGLCKVPVLGAFFSEQSPYLYLTLLITLGVWVVFYKTKYGLRYRAIGDQPFAVQTAGVDVNRYRYVAMMTAGAIAGLGGSYLSISQNNLFVIDMVAGRGFMGLAANIFGGWQPLGSLGAGMVFRSGDPVPVRTDAAICGNISGPGSSWKACEGTGSTWQTGGLVLYLVIIADMNMN